MGRYFIPIGVVGTFSAILAMLFLFFVPPVSPPIVGLFLIFFGLSLASLISLGLYYLRRFWGPKDSPRILLRNSIRQSLIAALGLDLILVLQILGAANWLNFFLLGLLLVVMERLTK